MFTGFSRRSEWSWVTSTGKSVGAVFMAGGLGDLVLKRTYDTWRFHYRWIGASLSFNPLKRMPFSTQQSTEATYSDGVVFLNDYFPGDLGMQDIQGPCLITDASFAFGFGSSLTGIAIGLPGNIMRRAAIGRGPRNIILGPHDVKAIIITGSYNQGLQLGAGITAAVGYISLGDPEDMMLPIEDMKFSRDQF